MSETIDAISVVSDYDDDNDKSIASRRPESSITNDEAIQPNDKPNENQKNGCAAAVLDGETQRPTGETKPQNEFILFCWLTTNSFW